MGITDITSGEWDKIFNHYKIPITKGNRHYKGPCPLCKKEGKFRLFKDWIISGSYVCVCSSGNGITLLMNLTNKTFREVAKELYKLLEAENKYPKYKKQQYDIMKNLKPISYYQGLKSIDNSPVESYLNSRNIYVMPFVSVKYSEKEKFYKETYFSAMYAIATTDDNEIAYKHCTFLDKGVKIPHKDAKKMYKVNEVYDPSIAVRMFPVKNTLGISEGIETGLSCAQMYDLPVWSTLNSTLMKKFKAPKGVEHLYIYADNDNNGTGLEAAFQCGRTNILSPNDVQIVDIIWPFERGDFNDILQNKISNQIVSWRLDKK